MSIHRCPRVHRRSVLRLMAVVPAALALPALAMAAPGEVMAALPAARLLGQGTMRYFGFSVYQARLWVGEGFDATRYAQHAFALELQYGRRLYGRAVAERSLEEMRRQGGFSEAQAQAWLSAMTQAFPDVVDGDRLTGLFTPVGPTRFYLNGKLRADVPDPAFGPVFAGIWLSASTSEPALRQRLLGGA
jgi:hypothetical protein